MNTTEEHPSHDRMRSALRGAAAGLDLQAPGPETVRRTAHHRARRQQRVTAGIASVAVIAGAAGIAGLVNREPGVELETGAVGNSPSGTTFTWTEGEQVLSAQPRIVQGADGVLYALSTAPGVTYEDAEDGEPLPQAVYTSTDGVTWQPTELDPDMQLATLDIREDGVLYGLSTAPGTAALRVATSADGGTSWQLDELPLATDQPAVAEGVTLASAGAQLDLATRAGTTVVTVQRQWWVEPEGLLTPEESEHSWLVPAEEGLLVQSDTGDRMVGDPEMAADGAAAGDPAVEAELAAAEAAAAAGEAAPPGIPATGATPVSTDEPAPAPTPAPAQERAEPQVIRTIPWAEIGLTGPQDLITSDTFTAIDGGEWTPVDLPVDGSAEIEATAEGFVAILHRDGNQPEQPTPMQVARSADGLEWTLDDAPMGEAIWVNGVGTIGDRVVVTAVLAVTSPDYSESVVVSSSGDAGRTWQTTDLTALVPPADGHQSFIGASDTGPLGIAAAVQSFEADSGENQASMLLYSPDGVSWDLIPGEQLDPDSTGVSWLSVDADRIIASVFQPDQTVRTVVGVPTR